jgi:hypothetical protein
MLPWRPGLKKGWILRFVVFIGACLAFALVLTPHTALGYTLHRIMQGCAMCYQNASATGAQGREALRDGVLVLLFPTLSLFVGILALIYRRRNLAR